MIYTFYSFKGGVGRSMALANMAELFYHAGLKVLMIDFDLEAPGLERFFDVPEAVYSPNDVVTNRGLIDMLISYKKIRVLPPENTPLKDLGKDLEVRQESSLFSAEPIIDFCIPIYQATESGGTLNLIPSGLRDNENFTAYAENVKSFDWEDFYINWEGEKFFEWFRAEVESIADVILIDSRTGITEVGGICTHHLADVVVMFVASNQQNIEGSVRVATSLSNIDLIEKGRNGRPLRIIPIPSRIESFAPESLDEFAAQFNQKLGDFIPRQLKFEKSYFSELKIPYTPAYSFQERVVVRELNRESAADLIEAFERMASALGTLSSENSKLHNVDFSRQIKESALRGCLKRVRGVTNYANRLTMSRIMAM